MGLRGSRLERRLERDSGGFLILIMLSVIWNTFGPTSTGAGGRAGQFLLDEITWNDLDLDRVFRRINPALSASGSNPHYMLRSPAIEAEVYAGRQNDCPHGEKSRDCG